MRKTVVFFFSYVSTKACPGNFELPLDKLAGNNLVMLVVIADLNAKPNNWYLLDKNFMRATKWKT